MKLVTTAAVIAIAGLFTGCGSSISVNHDFDQSANFAAYKTFQWMAAPLPQTGGSAQVAQQRNSLLEGRIKNAVVDQLTAKGMTAANENPDVYVTYHIGAQDKVDVQSYGYGYGYGSGRYHGAWGGSGGIETYNYTEGTLIIDIVNASSKQLSWRGTAQGVIDPDPSPEQLTENINRVVAKILESYPPSK